MNVLFLAEILKKRRLCVVFWFQNLTAAIHAAFQVNVVRTVKFTGIRVFHISRLPKGVMAPTPAATSLCYSTFGNRHGICLSLVLSRLPAPSKGKAARQFLEKVRGPSRFSAPGQFKLRGYT